MSHSVTAVVDLSSVNKIFHTVTFEISTSHQLHNSRSSEYAERAIGSYEKYLVASSVIKPESGDHENMLKWFAAKKEIAEHSVTIVLYVAMALEAAIFDLAAIHLGQKYAEEVVDKLDLKGKWLVIPRLICGKGLNEEGPGVQSLSDLTPENRIS
jgi:hypothetical protein